MTVASAARWLMQRAVVALALICATASGCQYPNCEQIVDGRCIEPMVSEPGSCASTSECAAPSVCDLAGTRRCVQCTRDQPDACSGAAPVCGGDNLCRACGSHDDCASRACLADGACAAEPEVAYVDPDGSDNAICSQQMPCTRVASALATGRRHVKLRGVTDEAVTIGSGRVVTVLADPGAVLTHSNGAGPVFTVRDDGTVVKVYDLAVGDKPDGRDYAIQVLASGSPQLSLNHVIVASNAGGGISVAAGSFTLTRSMVIGNVGGGLAIDGRARFALVNNVFVGNGSANSVLGAIDIATYESPSNRIEFNTFYRNVALGGGGAAIQCSAGVFTARNNILSDNGSPANPEQVGGTCAHAYSIIRPGTMPAGPGNQAADPRFVNPSLRDFRLDPASPAIGAADPASDLTGVAARDFTGAPRARPATIGAYQQP